MEHILNLEQVKKYYGGNSGNITKAVDGISMYVDKGEFVAIMGASGSGKTTLLNCISTIDTVTSGHITVNNQDITKIKDKDFADFRRENLGFIFQDFNLLDTLTIGENIGGADIFLDHSGSTYIIPKLSLYSTGLMPPKVILIRSSLYQ